MLKTLSRQEKQAVYQYSQEIRMGILEQSPVWLDDFTIPIFLNFAEKGTIVDVGCGIGRCIQPLFQQMGVNDYFGIDPSREAIRFCKENFPHHRFEMNEVRNLGDAYPETFGGFFMAAVLMHIPRTDLEKALLSLRKSMKVGAHGFFSTPSSDEGEVINRVGMRLTIYTKEELVQAFTSAGFEFVDIHSPDGWMCLGHVVAV